jgi:hypothetical protein
MAYRADARCVRPDTEDESRRTQWVKLFRAAWVRRPPCAGDWAEFEELSSRVLTARRIEAARKYALGRLMVYTAPQSGSRSG